MVNLLTSQAICHLLETSSFGAYTIDGDQTVLFWNRRAEEILGYSAQNVVGRRCCDALGVFPPGGRSLQCQEECPSLHHFRMGLIPSAFQLWMLCESGDRKLVEVTPIVVADPPNDRPVLFHLFNELPAGAEGMPQSGDSLEAGLEPQRGIWPREYAEKGSLPVTRRELEVLRLISLGRDTQRIADELNLSHHTVLNHIRNCRRKLQAPTRMDAVLTAMRRGLL